MIAAYMRHCSSAESFDSQRERLESWLEREEVDQYEWFIDSRSGVAEDRPAFERLRSAIDDGLVDTVYVCSLDRLSRNAAEADNLIELCQSSGTRLLAMDTDL